MDIQGTDNPIYTMTFSFSFYGPLWSKEVSLNAVILEKCFFFAFGSLSLSFGEGEWGVDVRSSSLIPRLHNIDLLQWVQTLET